MRNCERVENNTLCGKPFATNRFPLLRPPPQL